MFDCSVVILQTVVVFVKFIQRDTDIEGPWVNTVLSNVLGEILNFA